ncbi:MAG: hypothetical protein ACYS8W_19045 [Planctomycetota bacterium]|jgi:hypothetical protein
MQKILPVLAILIMLVGCYSGPSHRLIERDAEQEFKEFDSTSRIRIVTIRNILYPAEGRLALADCYIQAEKDDPKADEERFFEKDIQVKYRKKRGEWVRCTESEWEDILLEDPKYKYRQMER